MFDFFLILKNMMLGGGKKEKEKKGETETERGRIWRGIRTWKKEY